MWHSKNNYSTAKVHSALHWCHWYLSPTILPRLDLIMIETVTVPLKGKFIDVSFETFFSGIFPCRELFCNRKPYVISCTFRICVMTQTLLKSWEKWNRNLSNQRREELWQRKLTHLPILNVQPRARKVSERCLRLQLELHYR